MGKRKQKAAVGRQVSQRKALEAHRARKRSTTKQRRAEVQVDRYEEWEHLDGWRTYTDRSEFIYANVR